MRIQTALSILYSDTTRIAGSSIFAHENPREVIAMMRDIVGKSNLT